MGEFLERQRKTTKTDSEVENFNKLEASEEIELIILGLPTKKSPSPVGFSCELTRWLKKGISTKPAQTPPKKQKRKDYFPTHSLKIFP